MNWDISVAGNDVVLHLTYDNQWSAPISWLVWLVRADGNLVPVTCCDGAFGNGDTVGWRHLCIIEILLALRKLGS